MDKHHLLRRPAGSSIHGCNICGKEGHRAADCPNGSAVNWVERFGPNWTVDVDAIAAEARREPDYDALAKRAKAYAERKLAEGTMFHGGARLMAWAAGNAKVEPKGNAIAITKQAAGAAKIDPLMAMFNAVALLCMNPAAVGRSFWEVTEA